jgi:hypothetical protein
MAIDQDAAAGDGSTGLKDNVVPALSAAGAAIAQLASGLSTVFLAVLVLLGVVLLISAVRDSAFPPYWKFMPTDATASSVGIGSAHTWPDALAVALLGVGWTAIMFGLAPGMARPFQGFLEQVLRCFAVSRQDEGATEQGGRPGGDERGKVHVQ